jgi:phage terminase large subunit GpA-like protein
MASKHTYGDELGVDCPYCGKWTLCEFNVLEQYYQYYPDIICENCGEEIDPNELDINVKSLLEEETADGK